jgi:dienelactone hydrolase
MVSSLTLALLFSLAAVNGRVLRGNGVPPQEIENDAQLEEFLEGFPQCNNKSTPTDCSSAKNVTIGGQDAMLFNTSQKDKIVLLLHGWDLTCVNKAENYCDLAHRISELGYQVVLPRGNSGAPTTGQVKEEQDWALSTAQAVHNYFDGSKIALVGHSLGGGGTINVALNRNNKYNVPAFVAYVAMHPATIIAKQNLYQARGPILLTMGTDDSKYSAGGVSQNAIKAAYDKASTTKAYVDVKGNQHFDPANKSRAFGGIEFTALQVWLDCYLQNDNIQKCPDLNEKVCGEASVETCLYEE